MKHIVAVALVLCIILSFTACVKEEPIQTGIKLEDVGSFFNGEREDYQEKKVSKYKKEFSFRKGKYKMEGVLSGEDIIEATWIIPDVYANTFDDFDRVLADIKQGKMNDEKGLINVVLLTGLVISEFNIGEPTMGEIVDMVLFGKEIKSVDWTLSGKLDADKNVVTIKVRYQD